MHMNGTLGDRWGAETSPDGFDLYTQGAETIAPGILEYAQQIRVAGEDIFAAIARIRTQVQMTETQRQLLDMQIERARTGQPPLNLAQYGFAPTTGQQGLLFGMTPQTLLIIAVVVAVLLATPRKG